MKNENSKQRKTTLKWKKNGDLSEIDMLRILNKLSPDELHSCDLTCELWFKLIRIVNNKREKDFIIKH